MNDRNTVKSIQDRMRKDDGSRERSEQAVHEMQTALYSTVA